MRTSRCRALVRRLIEGVFSEAISIRLILQRRRSRFNASYLHTQKRAAEYPKSTKTKQGSVPVGPSPHNYCNHKLPWSLHQLSGTRLISQILMPGLDGKVVGSNSVTSVAG